MSRGPVVYSPPPGTVPQNPGDVIQSSVWNAFVDDVTLTFNTIQPVEYGGSNAATPIGAFDNFHTASTAIPSATTTGLGSASGYYVEITGTTTITGFGTAAAGILRSLRFSGALTLTYNATSLILPGAANITTAAGDTALFVSDGGGNWRCIGYQRASGLPLSELVPFLHIVDQKASGTNGGTSVATGTQKRDLTTIRTNRINGASLATNNITLLAGTYYAEASAPAAAAGRHKLELFNNTDTATILGGTSEFSAVNPGQGNVQTRSQVEGEFTITATKSISLFHYTELAVATIGIGIASTISSVPEVYTDIKIWQLK